MSDKPRFEILKMIREAADIKEILDIFRLYDAEFEDKEFIEEFETAFIQRDIHQRLNPDYHTEVNHLIVTLMKITQYPIYVSVECLNHKDSLDLSVLFDVMAARHEVVRQQLEIEMVEIDDMVKFLSFPGVQEQQSFLGIGLDYFEGYNPGFQQEAFKDCAEVFGFSSILNTRNSNYNKVWEAKSYLQSLWDRGGWRLVRSALALEWFEIEYSYDFEDPDEFSDPRPIIEATKALSDISGIRFLKTRLDDFWPDLYKIGIGSCILETASAGGLLETFDNLCHQIYTSMSSCLVSGYSLGSLTSDDIEDMCKGCYEILS